MNVILLALCILLCVCGVAAAAPEPVLFEASARVDLGADIGQNYGALFEAKDASGRTVLGAGFEGVFNTASTNDRHTLQFFARPPQDRPQFSLKPVGKPNATTGGTYIFDLGGRLCSLTYGRLTVFDPVTAAWREEPGVLSEGGGFGDIAVDVGEGRLVCTKSGARYNDRVILSPPAEGAYSCFHYALGHLCFYYTKPGTGDGRTSLYACPWTPASPGPIDLAQAKVLTLTFSGETPFSWGQFRGQIVTCANTGGFYVFDTRPAPGQWRVLRAPDRSVSYQIYTMINCRDKLLLGQYPSGSLFEYDGEKITPREKWPPVMPGVSPSARECQSAAIYRGDLYVGVWPWAEVWRYDADGSEWSFAGRAFTQPPITDKFQHPYEEEIRAYNAATGAKIVFNNWGQRATSLVPLGTDLYVGTSAKGAFDRDKNLGFLTDEVFAEYGRVLKLTLPGHLSAHLTNVEQPMDLRFVLTPSKLCLYRDGKLLAEAPVEKAFTTQLKPVSLTWRQGIFGDFSGSLSRQKASVPVTGK